jgi:hypothetical protein
METEESKRQDVTLQHCAGHSVGSELETAQVLRAGHRLAAAEQPTAVSAPEPTRLKTVGNTPWSLTSRSTISKPDEESWDFDGSVLPSARNRTRQSPMLTHETSLVSRASVAGMTSRVGQGQRCLPANVPGISMTLSQEDRLRPKGRLRQQPVGDSTEESQSRRRQQDPSNGCLPKVAWPRQDRQEQGTGVMPATLDLHHSAGRSLPHERI